MPKVFNSFDDVNLALKAYIPVGAHEAYRLDRMVPLMKLLDNPQDRFRAVHVAGTSGKTSTCYYIAALLRQSGAKVGLTVSPHIDEVNERVQVNLVPLPETTYCNLFGEFMDIVSQAPVKPTYFELLVAFAYWVFAKEEVDYAVIEVGLGGLLDSTNIITRPDKVCVLTDIGMDHMEILGKTLPEIAAQKAGIIRPYNTVFMYQQQESVMKIVREVCEQQKAELHEVVPITIQSNSKLPLFQQRNSYLAGWAVGFVLDDPQLRTIQNPTDMNKVMIPGRMDVFLVGGKTLILDGAHNQQKMLVFIESLKLKYPHASFAVMIAMKRSKTSHLRTALEEVCRVSPHLVLTSFDGDSESIGKAIPPIKIAETCHLLGYDNWELHSEPREAFDYLLSRPEEVLVVTGSLYLVAYIRKLLRTTT